MQGCDNAEIANNSKWLAERQGAFQPAFSPFGITDGIKRVKRDTLISEQHFHTTLRKPHPTSANACHRTIAQGLKNRDVAQAIGTTDSGKNYLRVIYESSALEQSGIGVVYRIAPAGPGLCQARLRRGHCRAIATGNQSCSCESLGSTVALRRRAKQSGLDRTFVTLSAKV